MREVIENVDQFCAIAGADAKAEAGEAFVVFANPMDFQMALQRDRQTMGGRSIEVYRGKREDYYLCVHHSSWM